MTQPIKPTYTLENLAALKSALASGFLIVRINEHETHYRSIADLQKAIDLVEKELTIRPKGPHFIKMGGA